MQTKPLLVLFLPLPVLCHSLPGSSFDNLTSNFLCWGLKSSLFLFPALWFVSFPVFQQQAGGAGTV